MSCSRYSFCFTALLFAPASVARMSSFSPLEALSARLTALLRCSKNSLPVGAELARLSSARAKVGSSEAAFSKCAMESVMTNLSARSRPCRNSVFASADAVVTGIFPALRGVGLVSAVGAGASFFAQAQVATPAATPSIQRRARHRFGRMMSSLACEYGGFDRGLRVGGSNLRALRPAGRSDCFVASGCLPLSQFPPPTPALRTTVSCQKVPRSNRGGPTIISTDSSEDSQHQSQPITDPSLVLPQ